VHGLRGDSAEAVQERGRAGGAVVVVGAEEQDVARAQLLAAGLDGLLDLGGGDVVPALVLLDVDAERVAAEGVERELGDRGAARVVVAERVDVGGGVIRRDDDLGCEGGPSGGRVRVQDVAEDLRRRKERGVAASPATAAGRGRSRVGPCSYSFPESSLQTWTIRGTTAATMRSPSSRLARVASPTTPDAVMSRSMSIGTITPGPFGRSS
jgi:hypothetical protein